MKKDSKFKELCDSRKLTFISELKQFKDEIPSDWFMSDYEIEEKIKELSKEIYRLKNSRKKQPRLIIIEGTDKIDRVRIFQGFKIIDLDKRVVFADNWYEIKTKQDASEIYKQYELSGDFKKYLDNL